MFEDLLALLNTKILSHGGKEIELEDNLKEALKNYLNPSDENSDETATTSETTETSTENKTATAPAKTENVEDAFDQLFNS